MKPASDFEFEVCVSDNCSTDNTSEVVREAQEKIAIKYYKNSTNLGIPRNFLNVVAMATGEFAWLVGDDDLLLPDTLITLSNLLNAHTTVDFFYINSYHLNTEFIFSFPQPFDTSHLPQIMISFSNYSKSGEMRFMNLINPKISFDFLGGMFLAVFRRSKWIENMNVLDPKAVIDIRTFSHFDNTFPHVKIFSKAFAKSQAYFQAEPLSVCLTGAREWAPMYPFVASVRLVEALDEYKKNGLSFLRYLWCRNFALNNFIPHFVSMYIHRKRSGFAYINPYRLLISNCLFPNFYLSVIYFFVRRFKHSFGKKNAVDE